MKPVLLLLVALLLPACASGGARPLHGDPDRLEPADIEQADAHNALEVVQRLRPRWLTHRTDRSTRLETVILVYLDGARLGGLEELREIPVLMIQSMRLLDAAEAGMLPGLGSQHVERVIMISTRSR